MNLAKRLTELPPSLRWWLGAARTKALYRHAFGAIGRGTVIVSPRQLKGVENIFIGAGVAIYAGAWLQCEPDGGPIRIGDGTYLGHDVHVHAIDPVSIGSRCVLADGVFVASTDHDRDERSHSSGTGPISIGDGVFIGQRAMVLGGVSIGCLLYTSRCV